ncbi:MAG: Diadenosine hexaphosphate hydrolase [Candidatus Heimdallarchaeota archaeon LC_3]|nr:MAG: Diadenosine hexaphosphate hydrolase [Candidatus Heimdallarchaeota archaeon LC_3]
MRSHRTRQDYVIHSVGGVLFREARSKKGEKWEFLLLQHKRGKHWDFPKGRREKGENDMQTAKREIWEETGYSPNTFRFLKRLQNVIRFTVHRGKSLLPKEVRLFLVRVSNDVQVKLSSEHIDYAWTSYEEAIDIIRHKSSQKILKEAHRWLEENSSLLQSTQSLTKKEDEEF